MSNVKAKFISILTIMCVAAIGVDVIGTKSKFDVVCTSIVIGIAAVSSLYIVIKKEVKE
ncbi:MAG: hypothetical protein ACRC7S_17335 [Cetobacterium sp.]